jgi:hypothetical protein
MLPPMPARSPSLRGPWYTDSAQSLTHNIPIRMSRPIASLLGNLDDLPSPGRFVAPASDCLPRARRLALAQSLLRSLGRARICFASRVCCAARYRCSLCSSVPCTHNTIGRPAIIRRPAMLRRRVRRSPRGRCRVRHAGPPAVPFSARSAAMLDEERRSGRLLEALLGRLAAGLLARREPVTESNHSTAGFDSGGPMTRRISSALLALCLFASLPQSRASAQSTTGPAAAPQPAPAAPASQPAAPPSPATAPASPPTAPQSSEAQVAPHRWDVDRVRCADLLRASDDDRASAAMFYYGYLAAKAGIRVIDVSRISGNIGKVMQLCEARPNLTVPQAFREALRPTPRG